VSNVERRLLATERDPWVKKHKAGFDRVLVDAPCTGTGTWRRNPDARWFLAPSDLGELVAKQARILDSAARLVRPGGRLVYVTCSLLPQEDEDQAADFLAKHPDFRALPVATIWQRALGGRFPGAEGPFLLLTPLRHGTDGFFVAVFEREAAQAAA
jgi:16S rRNA (cytosine967-C5)-methyltransferase